MPPWLGAFLCPTKIIQSATIPDHGPDTSNGLAASAYQQLAGPDPVVERHE
jgi:hypothetical protein